VVRSSLRPSFCEPQCSHHGQQRGFLLQASITEFCSSAFLLLSLILSTAVMSYFVLSTVFAVATTATLLHDIPLAPALRFAGHNNSQVPTAARDVFSRLLNRQVTCPPSYGLCTNGKCCPTTDNCCTNSDLCVEAGGRCCSDNQHTCLPDWNCCGGYCSPVNEQCCTTGYYCPNGWWCVLYSGQQYCCDGLGCLGTYNPMYQAVPTITAPDLRTPTSAAESSSSSQGFPAQSAQATITSSSSSSPQPTPSEQSTIPATTSTSSGSASASPSSGTSSNGGQSGGLNTTDQIIIGVVVPVVGMVVAILVGVWQKEKKRGGGTVHNTAN